MSASIVAMRSNLWIIDATSSRTLRLLRRSVSIALPLPDASFLQFGGNSFGQNFASDLPDLVARLLALGIGGEQMVLAARP